MVVGYIKLENVSGIFSKIIGIEIRKFDNNYVIAISKDNNLVRKRLVKYIKKSYYNINSTSHISF